ncbi:MAG TPA: BlaI/MecI/CopY family transcriptional regulator [Polyangiaceae bacterium]|nr:BlaI/MecI/CopY family transcriptional regulator [Polyangiaceae bacterium]
MLRRLVYPPLLGALESSVQDHLWEHGSGTAKSVHAALGRRRGIAVNTVQSTLKRLFDKGLLTRKKVSHAHVYQPRIKRTEFQRGVLAQLIEELMGGRVDDTVSVFVELVERAGPKHLEHLEKLVRARRTALRRSRP